jgi:hypothetical protein
MSSVDRDAYPESNYKSVREWHVYHVYNDPEFIEATQKLNEHFLDKVDAAHDKPAGFTPHEEATIAKLAADYAISPYDIEQYQTGLFLQGILNTDQSYYDVSYDATQDKIYIGISPDFRKADMDKLWGVVEELRVNIGRSANSARRRPPLNHALLYAVFKARQQGKTYRQIYDLYDEGKLPYYIGKWARQFSSEESLERYYRKYRPDT